LRTIFFRTPPIPTNYHFPPPSTFGLAPAVSRVSLIQTSVAAPPVYRLEHHHRHLRQVLGGERPVIVHPSAEAGAGSCRSFADGERPVRRRCAAESFVSFHTHARHPPRPRECLDRLRHRTCARSSLMSLATSSAFDSISMPLGHPSPGAHQVLVREVDGCAAGGATTTTRRRATIATTTTTMMTCRRMRMASRRRRSPLRRRRPTDPGLLVPRRPPPLVSRGSRPLLSGSGTGGEVARHVGVGGAVRERGGSGGGGRPPFSSGLGGQGSHGGAKK